MSEEFVLQETTSASGGTEFELIPDGTIVEAELLSCEKNVKPWQIDGNPVVRVDFAFRILDDPHRNRQVWGSTSTTFTTHPDCRLRAWVQELFALDDLPVGFKFEPKQLVGLKARIAIDIDRWEDKKTGKPRQKNNVADVIRSRDAVSSAPAPVPVPASAYNLDNDGLNPYVGENEDEPF